MTLAQLEPHNKKEQQSSRLAAPQPETVFMVQLRAIGEPRTTRRKSRSPFHASRSTFYANPAAFFNAATLSNFSHGASMSVRPK
jgi:hypothetical protein